MTLRERRSHAHLTADVSRQMNLRTTIVACIVAIAGCDLVATNYDSIAEARNDRVFERGWLPDILPHSTTRIRVSNDLDLNVGEGEFSYAPSDAPRFHAQLRAKPPDKVPFSDWDTFVRRHASDGYSVHSYLANGTTWVFLCHEGKGRCVYRMWLARNAG